MLQQKFSFMVFVLGLSKIKNCGVIIIFMRVIKLALICNKCYRHNVLKTFALLANGANKGVVRNASKLED